MIVMDAEEIKHALAAYTESEKAALIECVKAATGGYELDDSGVYSLSEHIDKNQLMAQRVEQLLIPTIKAGHLPLESADFVSRMLNLGSSEEEIFKTLAYFIKEAPPPEIPVSSKIWWGILGALFLFALLRACVKLGV